MRNATDLDRLVPLEQLAPRCVNTCSDTPVVVFQRAFVLRGIVAAAIEAVGAVARQAYARHRQRLEARAIYDALQQLDDCTLRDLGIHRSEISSIAAEVTGEAERTRVRVLLMAHDLSY